MSTIGHEIAISSSPPGFSQTDWGIRQVLTWFLHINWVERLSLFPHEVPSSIRIFHGALLRFSNWQLLDKGHGLQRWLFLYRWSIGNLSLPGSRLEHLMLLMVLEYCFRLKASTLPSISNYVVCACCVLIHTHKNFLSNVFISCVVIFTSIPLNR
jgi:hypothetical protein